MLKQAIALVLLMTANGRATLFSSSTWRAEFGGRDVRGEQLQVGDVRATVIGVAPQGFAGVDDANPPQVYIPITTFAGSSGTDDAKTYFTAYNWGWVRMLVRREADVSLEEAQADATQAFRRSWLAAHIQYRTLRRRHRFCEPARALHVSGDHTWPFPNNLHADPPRSGSDRTGSSPQPPWFRVY